MRRTPVRTKLAIIYGKMKKFDGMKRELAAWVELNKYSYPLANLDTDAYVAYLADDRDPLRRLLRELEVRLHDERGPSAYDISSFYFALGEKDKGFEWLGISYSKKEIVLLGIQISERFDSARTDPRYLDMLKKLGLDQTVGRR